MSLYKVLDNILDSKNSTVGGGSASAMAGAMAAGLVGMVARLSLEKRLRLDDHRYTELANELDTLSQELAQGAQDDTQAFLAIKEAFSMPKASDDEKKVRTQAIEEAAVKAASIPMLNAQKAERILKICHELEGNYNPNASSDFVAGTLLAKTAVIGCALNIDANLPLIKTPERRVPLEKASKEFRDGIRWD
ncbi:MAG: formiminotransferase-cyclodeaminase [Dethiosulfovibrio peptidovorans]|nr:MAG: formiminotransferase-cyclodeaminase [Dethiosulfovibrio peptidovorans]